jgi:hypothetical protein
METSASVAQQLVDALRDRHHIIADRDFYKRDPEGHLAALQTVSERIEKLQAKLPRPLHPQLAHFLERRSYDKALAFLESSEQQT